MEDEKVVDDTALIQKLEKRVDDLEKAIKYLLAMHGQCMHKD